jgi:hypothetical protein
MKKINSQVGLFCFFMFLHTFTGFADEVNKLEIQDYEPFYGKWVCKEYSGSTENLFYGKWKKAQKLVFYSWGYGERFLRIADERPQWRFTFVVAEKWTDSKGNACYKVFAQEVGAKGYYLIRTSKDRNILEMIWRSVGFPSESDLTPSYSNYWKYQRQ